MGKTPQLEDGYTKIANEIVEVFCHYRLSGEEWLVLWAIIRKTYGWKKKSDNIALKTFADMTKLKRQTAQRALNNLVEKKVISVIKNDDRKPNNYAFNKVFSTWKLSSKKITVKKLSSKMITPVIKNDVSSVINIEALKRKERNYIKENQRPGAADTGFIQRIFDVFYKINPTINFGNKTQRTAITEMSKLWGEEKTENMAKYAVGLHGVAYAPTITTPYQLKLRASELISFWKKENNKEVKTPKTKLTAGRLHDGTRVVKKFGQWVDADNSRLELNTGYYPELTKDQIASEEEWEQIKNLPANERLKIMLDKNN